MGVGVLRYEHWRPVVKMSRARLPDIIEDIPNQNIWHWNTDFVVMGLYSRSIDKVIHMALQCVVMAPGFLNSNLSLQSFFQFIVM